jgi:hypothetical protein
MLAEASGVNEFRERLLDVAGPTHFVDGSGGSGGGGKAPKPTLLSEVPSNSMTRTTSSSWAFSEVSVDVGEGLWGMALVDERVTTEKRLQEIFSEIDLDGSGTLNRSELAEMFRRSSSGGKDDLSEHALDTVMAELSALRYSSTPLPGTADAGEIDFQHFCDWYMKHSEDKYGFMNMIDKKVEFSALRELKAPFIAVGVEYTGLSMLLPILAWFAQPWAAKQCSPGRSTLYGSSLLKQSGLQEDDFDTHG